MDQALRIVNGSIAEPQTLLVGANRLVWTLKPTFAEEAFEVAAPLLLALADEAGLGPQPLVTEMVSRTVQRTLAARCLTDRLSERRLNRVAAALFVVEVLHHGEEVVRRPPKDEPWDKPALDAVEEFALTSDWTQVKDEALREQVSRRLERLARARLSLSDAVVAAVQEVAGNEPLDVYLILDEDEKQAQRWVQDCNRNRALARMAAAEEVLTKHGRRKPIRYGTTDIPSPRPDWAE